MNTGSLAFVTGIGIVVAATASIAQEAPRLPPTDAVKLSEIIVKVEAREGFRYVDDVEWDDDGYYTVVYFTKDNAKVEINYDTSGEPKAGN